MRSIVSRAWCYDDPAGDSMMTDAANRVQPEARAAMRLSYEDYLAFPDDGQRWELIDGKSFVSPAPGAKHQGALFELTHFLGGYLRERSLGRAFIGPFNVILSDMDAVQPDFLFLRNENLGRLKDTEVRGAPDLVVEVLSESTRRLDEKVKLGLYERCGIEEYWIVDPVLETVEVRRRGEAGFGSPELLARETGHTLATPLLPGLEIPLAELFSP